jgi:hypothetical protein
MGAMAAVSTYLPVGVCRQLLQGRRVYDAELHLGQSDTNCTQPTILPAVGPYKAYMMIIVIVMMIIMMIVIFDIHISAMMSQKYMHGTN